MANLLPELQQSAEQKKPVNLLAELPQATEPAVQQQAQPQGALETAVGIPLEFAAAVNRGATNLADFLTTDQINAVLQIAGAEGRVPSITEALSPATKGEFLEPGTTRKVVRGAGEVIPAALSTGGALRQAAAAIPKAVGPGTATQNIVRQLSGSTAVQDIGFGGLSGAGSEVGREGGGEVGAFVGSILAPASFVGVQAGLTKLIGLGARGIRTLTTSLNDLSEEGASQLLSEAMVREGLDADDIVAQLAQLGPEGIPADVGNNFARLLRAASNKIPSVEGRAAKALGARQAGQTGRIVNAFDEQSGLSGLSVDDEIVRLNNATKPDIDRLYDAARAKPIRLTAKLNSLFTGDSSSAKALGKARTRLADRIAAGDEIPGVSQVGVRQRPILTKEAIISRKPIDIGVDVIDAVKQELDDQIGVALRKGKNNRVRDLVRLKNVMVQEADSIIPEYKQARDLFAGKAQLENAADNGTQFFKLKPREVDDFIKTMGASEKRMFRLGAKQAILDKIDTLQPGTDSVKRLFGRKGDIAKLRSVFDDEAQFNNFKNTLERESNFMMTRRAAQANSTTAQQQQDIGNASDVLSAARAVLGSPSDSANLFARIISGLTGKKTDAAFIRSLEQAGDILLEKGMDPARIQRLLADRPKVIEAALRPILIPTAPAIIAGSTGSQ